MAISIIRTGAVVGVEPVAVNVETHISNGLPGFVIVGLPQAAVRESRERVRSAIINSGFEYPSGRITVNLAPAELPKSGGRYDLAIALGILVASGRLAQQLVHQGFFFGELALSGALRPLTGLLPSVLACRRNVRNWVVVPAAQASELYRLNDSRVFCARSLSELVGQLEQQSLQLLEADPLSVPAAPVVTEKAVDFADIKGQDSVKRALEVAASGGHHVLMSGPPGSGKTLLAEALPSILPALGQAEALEVAALHSISGRVRAGDLWQRVPFRQPHHQTSAVALLGGGTPVRPGEMTLAHRGVLFLDELGEFRSEVLESLRQPLETGYVQLSRSQHTYTFPAQCQLVAATNPCPCGSWGDSEKSCQCTLSQRQRYLSRLSGPLLDRFDLHLSVHRVSYRQLSLSQEAESSDRIANRVEDARERQMRRQGCLNSALSGTELARFCNLGPPENRILEQASQRMQLSARGCHRLLRVARSIADLQHSDRVGTAALMEALSYRQQILPRDERLQATQTVV